MKREDRGSPTICISAGVAGYPQGAGHMWAYLNWALSLRALGCRVLWLEDAGEMVASQPLDEANGNLALFAERLERLGMPSALVLADFERGQVDPRLTVEHLDVAAAVEASDLLLNFSYEAPESLIAPFPRTALVDLDPGLTQVGMDNGDLHIEPHDVWFTIGETVGSADAAFPDVGVRWEYTPPPVYLGAWDPTPLPADGAYTTVTNWWGGEWVVLADDDEGFDNSKRTAFMPLLDLPGRVPARVEIALTPDDYTMTTEVPLLRENGWSVRDAWTITDSPEGYRDYIRASRGELSAAKPSCRIFANAWVSDRTVCYLASGRPAVVEHTGPSRILPDDEGLLRFRDVDEAAAAIRAVEADPEHHARRARELAEEVFDGERLMRGVLERALA